MDKMKLKLVVDNSEAVSKDTDLKKLEEKLLGLCALSRTLQEYPILQEMHSLQVVQNKISVLKDKMIEQGKIQGQSLIEQTKENFGHLLEKRELQSELVDFCKSIKHTIVCEKELDFEITFHHHVLIGVLAMFQISSDCVIALFTGVSGTGKKHSALLYVNQMLSKEEIETNEELKKQIAHSALSQTSLSLTEYHKEFVCKQFGVIYGENNVIEFNSNSAKVLKFQSTENSTGPYAG